MSEEQKNNNNEINNEVENEIDNEIDETNNETEDELDNEDTQQGKKEKEQIIELNPDNVDDQIDYLDDYVVNNISVKGFYTVDYVPLDIYTENGEKIELDKEDESYKERQKIKRVGIKDIFDLTKQPPVIRDEFYGKNIIYCSEYGKLYYGGIDIKTFKDKKGKEEFIILPDEKGRFYDDKKCVYAGYFENGKKTSGLIFEKNGEKFLFDHKGDKNFVSHYSDDLLISFETDDEIAKNRRKSDFEKYSNAVVFSSKTGEMIDGTKFKSKAGIKNIKIQIDNGYRCNFLDKNNDYLDDNGNRILYNKKDENKMYIDVKKITETIKKYIKKYKNTLNVIEVVGISNYGFLKDESGNDLFNEIISECKKEVGNDIKFFFSNTDDSITYATEQYKCGKKIITNVDHNRNYSKYNFTNNSFESFEGKDEYEKELENSGYYENILQSNSEDIEFGDFCLLKSSDKNFDDDFDKIKDEELAEEQKKIEEMKEKEKNINKDKLKSELKTQKSVDERNLSLVEMIIVFIGGIIFPIVGWFAVSNFLKSKRDQSKLIKQFEEEKKMQEKKNNKKQNNNNDAEKKEEEEKKTEEKTEDDKQQIKEDDIKQQDDNSEQDLEDNDNYSKKDHKNIIQKTDINLSNSNNLQRNI